MKFKIGEVVKTKNGKGVIISKFFDEIDTQIYYYEVVLFTGFKETYVQDALSKIKDEPFKVLKANRKVRNYVDHTFYLAYRGKRKFLSAGCRFFTNLKAARKHWQRDVSAWGGWQNDEDREAANVASLKIIDKFEKKMKG